MILGFSIQAHADLNLLGQGTSTHGAYNLIYDTDLDITWYDYTDTQDYASWQNEMDWADTLSVTFGSNVYTDWRLPVSDNCVGTCIGSEMGHLSFTELGNEGGLYKTGDFQNIVQDRYWSGTDDAANPDFAWVYQFEYSFQYSLDKNNYGHAIAVRDGLAVVPEPISSTLFLIGGATLGFRRLRKQVS